jgi:hypothetical protein
MELNGGFGYSTRRYGEYRENSLVEKSYSAGLSFYLFSTTALEFTYAESLDVNTNNEYTLVSEADQIAIIRYETRVKRKNMGVGLRQLLAPRGAFLTPMVSLGYVQQTISGEKVVTYQIDGVNYPVSYITPEISAARMMGMFMLKFNFSSMFSVNASVKTIIEPFKWDQARDDIKYEGGISWYF